MDKKEVYLISDVRKPLGSFGGLRITMQSGTGVSMSDLDRIKNTRYTQVL